MIMLLLNNGKLTINYIAVINLERNNETFNINLSNNYEINKEFGNGTFEK